MGQVVEISSWHSYPKIYALGHNAVSSVFEESVIVEEKVDGSQFSFGRFRDTLRLKSKGAIVYPESAGMFTLAAQAVQSVFDSLRDGWTYRGEYLSRPKHNVLSYDRVPEKNIIMFDINPSEEKYLSYGEKKEESTRIGFETVPLLYEGKVESVEQVLGFLERESCLGGPKIEGMVFKNYARYTPDGKAMLAKFVSEAFKEVHKKDWGESNPKGGDIIELISKGLRTEARWRKSIYRLRDEGSLLNDPKDIGPLLKAIQEDVDEECEGEIKDALYAWARKNILRKTVAGFPEFYKEWLLEKSFSEN